MKIRIIINHYKDGSQSEYAEIKGLLFWHTFDFNDALLYAENNPDKVKFIHRNK